MPDGYDELLAAAKHLLEVWESNKNLSQAAQRLAAAVRNV